ncbi:hypothetical protein K4L06_15310 [Lysobacter sp. BMK333-48F3]|uniref:hypothetical protein n=1 Tax=Lysobacter sp. BMK333-48F3 TaxID=2867962 RepID=UPI001C8B0B72|nr:hypothetical protein [Lysobacter sp. BMK333-48F3]MBX9402677.1 hypothetical protein [Lysobacter sp. BMK333-48F3]
MSQPAVPQPLSLYARFTLDLQRYQAYMDSAPAHPSEFGDWPSPAQAGHGERRGHAEALADPQATTVAEMIKAWRQDPWTGTPPVEYDELRRELRIVMLQASGHPIELLRVLGPLRGAAGFNDAEADDFVLAFDSRGSGEVRAYLTLGDGLSRFDGAPPRHHLDEARRHLDRAAAYLRERAG